MPHIFLTKLYHNEPPNLTEAELDAAFNSILNALNVVRLDDYNIASGALDTQHIKPSAVTTTAIVDGALTSGSIAASSLGKDKVSASVLNRLFDIGDIVIWPGIVLPAGWLSCNGEDVLVSDFPQLASKLDGNPNYTSSILGRFKLPQYNRRFPKHRKVGDELGKLIDYTTGLDELTLSASGEHSHTVSFRIRGDDGGTSNQRMLSNVNNNAGSPYYVSTTDGAHNHTTFTGGASETAPDHIHLNYIIRGR